MRSIEETERGTNAIIEEKETLLESWSTHKCLLRGILSPDTII